MSGRGAFKGVETPPRRSYIGAESTTYGKEVQVIAAIRKAFDRALQACRNLFGRGKDGVGAH